MFIYIGAILKNFTTEITEHTEREQKNTFTLETERLILRPFIVDDVVALRKILGDSEVMRFFSFRFIER